MSIDMQNPQYQEQFAGATIADQSAVTHFRYTPFYVSSALALNHKRARNNSEI